MRYLLMLLAGALTCACTSAAYAADSYTDDEAQVVAAAQADMANTPADQSFDDWYAATGGMETPVRVMGLLTKAEVQQMRDAHAAAGLKLGLSVVPAGGINQGKYYVSGTLAPEMMAAMMAAHETGGLQLDLRAMPMSGAVMGDRRERGRMDDDEDDEDDDEMGDDDAGDNGDWQRGPGGTGGPGEWHGGPGNYGEHGRRGRGEGRGAQGWHGRGAKGWRGGRGWGGGYGNYDVRDHCGHWEQDWHQDGCGSVHVHNLADWLPDHPGWGYGFPYGGLDDDFWPHVRNDGSQTWYTGEWWRNANVVYDVPAWFDAQWAAFGDAYPDTFWMSTQRHGFGGWNGGGSGCGCGGCQRMNRCNSCGKWSCGCGHHKCGCG
jgi:hypothetical protein